MAPISRSRSRGRTRSRTAAKDRARSVRRAPAPPARVVPVSRGGDHNDRATVNVSWNKAPKDPKIRFPYEVPSGHATVVRYCALRQVTANTWNVQQIDDHNQNLEFFTPRKFKDIEGRLFNGKTAAFNSYGNVTTAQLNFPPGAPVFIAYSSVFFEFKNVSQHVTFVQMFICWGRNNKDGNASPVEAINAANDSYNHFSAIQCTNVGFNPLSNQVFNKMWRMQCLTFKFEPGEQATHNLLGPKRYVMHGLEHCAPGTIPTLTTDPSWFQPEIAGNGCRIFFRTLNQGTLVSGTTGDTNSNFGVPAGFQHPPHLAPTGAGALCGGVVVKMSEYYIMKPGENVAVANVLPARILDNWFQSYTGTVKDIQVDADDSATIPTGPT